MDSEETQRHHVGAPLRPSPTGAATGSDAAAVEHDGHVVGALGLPGLGRHHGGTEVEPCRGVRANKSNSEQLNTENPNKEHSNSNETDTGTGRALRAVKHRAQQLGWTQRKMAPHRHYKSTPDSSHRAGR